MDLNRWKQEEIRSRIRKKIPLFVKETADEFKKALEDKVRKFLLLQVCCLEEGTLIDQEREQKLNHDGIPFVAGQVSRLLFHSFNPSEKTKLEADIESLKNEKNALNEEKNRLLSDAASIGSKLEADIESLENVKSALNEEKNRLLSDVASLGSKLEADICLLNKKKNVLESEIESDRKEKEKLRCDVELLNKEKAKVGKEVHLLEVEKCGLQRGIKVLVKETTQQGIGIDIMNSDKTILEKDIELLKKEKAVIAGGVELLNKEKFILAREKIRLGTDVELLNQEKERLQTDVELLKEEKDALHNVVSEEKDGFIHSMINEVNESIKRKMHRTKFSAGNEKMAARDIQELREAEQELIKQMESENVTRNTVIGLKRMRGESEDQVLWNYRENKRATLKEVISFQLNRTGK